jgi:hypothetical protein
MKRKHVVDLPPEKIFTVVQEVTRKAAANAVAAGRVVAGWEDGTLVEYGPGARPLVKAGDPADHGPPSTDAIAVIRNVAEPLRPTGKVRRRRTLRGESDD